MNYGDIIAVFTKNNLHAKILYIKNKLKNIIVKNNKIIIDKSITNYIYNPILHYQNISNMIHHLELSTNHKMFSVLLDNKYFPNLQFLFKYKNIYQVEIFHLKHFIRIPYKIDSLLEKNTDLINLLKIMNTNYIGIKKDIIINTFNCDKFYRNICKLPNYWKIQSCNQSYKDDNTIVSLEILIPELELNLIDYFIIS